MLTLRRLFFIDFIDLTVRLIFWSPWKRSYALKNGVVRITQYHWKIGNIFKHFLQEYILWLWSPLWTFKKKYRSRQLIYPFLKEAVIKIRQEMPSLIVLLFEFKFPLFRIEKVLFTNYGCKCSILSKLGIFNIPEILGINAKNILIWNVRILKSREHSL